MFCIFINFLFESAHIFVCINIYVYIYIHIYIYVCVSVYIYILAEYPSYGWALQLTPAESINETFASINFWDDKETEQTEPPD